MRLEPLWHRLRNKASNCFETAERRPYCAVTLFAAIMKSSIMSLALFFSLTFQVLDLIAVKHCARFYACEIQCSVQVPVGFQRLRHPV